MNVHEIETGAEARIREHRAAEFTVTLRDASGAPVPHARVTARLLRHEFRLGSNGFLLRGGGAADFLSRRRPHDALVLEYERRFADLLNYATLPFYWGGYEAEPGQESTERLRRMAAWCHDHAVVPKGHPLAWHEVFPKWAEALQDEEALRRLRERIGRIVGGFRGTVDAWDVFNETTVAERFDNAVGRWVKARGAAECVAEALRLARAAGPDAELLYNDFNVSPAMEDLVGRLREAGVSFDAVGIQSHMHKGAWTTEKTWQTCETYARFGLPLHFTEITLLSGRLKADDDNEWHRRRPDWNSTPEGEARQLEEGRRFYTTLFSHPAVEAATWWDFSDLSAWQGAPSGLLRNDMSLKPLAEWLRKAFQNDWTTAAAATSDAAGRASFRSFFGTHALRAETDNGVCLSGVSLLARRGPRAIEATVS
jgi:GH35 family endo-1,4-beta-xylanase